MSAVLDADIERPTHPNDDPEIEKVRAQMQAAEQAAREALKAHE